MNTDYDKTAYEAYLKINELKDTKESLAAFCIGNGLMAGNLEYGKQLYKEMGRGCRLWTCFCYPQKMTAEEFYDELISHKESFIGNMENLASISKEKWAEDWMETLQAWIEMEKGDFTD